MSLSKFFGFLFYLLGVCHAPLALAAAPAAAEKTLSVDDIRQKAQAIKDRRNLGDDIKNRIVAAYEESIDNLNEIERLEQQTKQLKTALNTLPVEIKQAARQIGESENQLKNRKPEKFSLFPADELEQRLLMEKTRLNDIDAEISRTETLVSELTNRPGAIRNRISEIKSKQTLVQQEQQRMATRNDEPLAEKEARQLLLETRARLFNVSLKALELENIASPQQLALQKNRLHVLGVRHEQGRLLLDDLENHLIERRQAEIEKAQTELAQAEKDAEGKHPLIQQATKENMAHSRLLQDIGKRMETFKAHNAEIERRSKQIESDFQRAEQRISLAGLSPVLGNLLREQRRNLPRRADFDALVDEIQNEIALTSLALFELDEARAALFDINHALMQRIQAADLASLDDTAKLRLRTELRMLLSDQKELVIRLSAIDSDYARMLGDVDFNLQQMLTSADKFAAYLDERLLWVPSAPVVDADFGKQLARSLWWFSYPANWLKTVTDLGRGALDHPIWLPLLLALVIAYWRLRLSVKTALTDALEKNRQSPHATGFADLLMILTGNVMLSLRLPLMMIALAWLLDLNRAAHVFTHAVADGLWAASLPAAVLQLAHRLFKPGGAVYILFNWQAFAVRLVYRRLRWLRHLVIVCVFIVTMTASDLFSEHSHSLGRVALITLMASLSWVLHGFAHPIHGLARTFYAHSNGWFTRLRHVWYLMAVLPPLVVIGFAVAGYYQSALELHDKLMQSIWLLIATIALHALALRWLAISRRRLVLQNVRQKRRHGETAVTSLDGSVPPVDDNLHDIGKISQQTSKLLATTLVVMLIIGVWMIWHDILPAFSVFDRIALWHVGELVDGKMVEHPVTLTSLLLCLVGAALTTILVRNFPALVDLLLAGKFAIAAGSRYALIQLVRYLLIVIAFLMITNELGGSWEKVQWLVAALSVGLGFGLQEIFANMVSGIILLFERPIRVGDTVTIGDVTGRVSRIQMRATHIVDWDSKELIVPNKQFITDRLVNWTLTDTITRLTLPVGVAYGSNPEQVERVLKDVVRSCDKVLTDPEPVVHFVSLGESSLDFTVYVYVRELGDRLPTTTELYKRICEGLKREGIEIPYPQRDVHIRSIADGIMHKQGWAT
ncbi:MAG: mechanosensitive ion channel [Methylomonas sp.]|nr:mechanosensitive ion channel [Methylomonas sp.]